MKGLIALPLALMLLAPGGASSQGVQVETHEDEMDSWTYAFVSSSRGPLQSVDQRGLVFGRAPHLLFVCRDQSLAVVYLYDTELIGVDGQVSVQTRFDDRAPSGASPWALVFDPSSAAEVDAMVTAMGVDAENPFLEMFATMAVAAQIDGEEAEAFITKASGADRVTVRVTDRFDGETHTDSFDLRGLEDAVDQVRPGCGG